ncbi:MAG: hypothetical protein PWP23_1210 [Candidatus Sumerlaeota bacterium]|nr:hypothetical protein [Candidatus Sumerlaeota bacterium]
MTPAAKIPTRPDLVVVPNSSTPADRSIEKRRLRKHSVLNVVRAHGPVSRAGISKISNFNLPSVSALVDELVEEGLVLEEEAQRVPRGRRPIPVHLNESAASILGIDIGKSSTIGLLLNLGGTLITRVEKRTPSLSTPKAHEEWVAKIAAQVFAETGDKTPPLAGIGIGLPGLIGKSSSGTETHNIATHLATSLEAIYGVCTIVENDARMMALGCMLFGQGKALSSFAVLNIGFGLGMGLVLDGRLFQGTQGFGGEIGHIPLGESGVPCYCGKSGCLENIVSGSGLVRLAKAKGLAVSDAAEVAELARKGDRKALAIFRTFSEHLGRTAAVVMNLYDPEAVILSGRVCRAGDLFIDGARAELERHVLAPIARHSELLVSTLDVDLGPIGAAAAVLHRIFFSSHVSIDEVI